MEAEVGRVVARSESASFVNLVETGATCDKSCLEDSDVGDKLNQVLL